MDFDLTDEEAVLRDSLRRFLSSEHSFERRQSLLREPWGSSPALWRMLAEQGVLGAGLPQAYGGFGAAVEVMIVMEEFGRALVLEPFLSSVVLCGGLIRDHGSEAQRGHFLPRIICGDCRGAFAHHESGARYHLEHVTSTARRVGTEYVLSGAKAVVQDGPVADIVIVSAQDVERGGLSLFMLDADTRGLDWTRYRTHDGRSAADLTLQDVRVGEQQRLGTAGAALPAIAGAVDQCIAALCAEAVGAMEALNEATLLHLKTRRQFGQPIGRFQVLQHRMADMFLQATQARSMSFLATGRAHEADARLRRHALSAAKAFIGRAARFVGQQAIQLHGGMGMSAELAISHYFKRLTVINSLWGDSDHHTAIVGDLILAQR